MLLFATTVIPFTSCSKDEEVFETSIVGTLARSEKSTSGSITIVIEQTETFNLDLTATGAINTYMNDVLMHSRYDFKWTYTYNGTTLKMTSATDGAVQTFKAIIVVINLL